VGIRTIIAVSAMATMSVPLPMEAASAHEVYYEEVSEPLALAVPTHSCDSSHHAGFLEAASYAHDAGFPGHELHTAVAVAYAESVGNAEAVNHNRNGSKDSGLWQINSVHGYSNLKNPSVNARAAFEVWSYSGWTAWYAHTPRGAEYGSGERFQKWLLDSRCSIDFYLDTVVHYTPDDERSRGEHNHEDAVPALR